LGVPGAKYEDICRFIADFINKILDDFRSGPLSPGKGAEKDEIETGKVGDVPVQAVDPVFLDGKSFPGQPVFDDLGHFFRISAEAGITDQDAHQEHSSISDAVDRT